MLKELVSRSAIKITVISLNTLFTQWMERSKYNLPYESNKNCP